MSHYNEDVSSYEVGLCLTSHNTTILQARIVNNTYENIITCYWL